jgi:hypothetical protein
MKAHKPKVVGASLRDKLSQNFLSAIQSDFEINGAAVIEQLRLKSPEKYAEIAARLIASIESRPEGDAWSKCQSTGDIGRLLLLQVGVNEFDITEEMIEKALAANDRLLTELETIAATKASFETALMRN